MMDAHVSIESFAGRRGAVPAEFRAFLGFLHLHQLSATGSLAPHRPPECRLGVKRDRRKLHLEPLHLPPEDNRATQSAVQADAMKTALASAQSQIKHHEDSVLTDSSVTQRSIVTSAVSVSESAAPVTRESRVAALAAKFAPKVFFSFLLFSL